MSRNTRAQKEFTREQRLVKENLQLKRELAHLRKQISRLDLESLESAKQLCFDQEEKDRLSEEIGEPEANLEDLKRIWACKHCPNGWLEINLYPKMGLTFYYRKCCNCKHRTTGQRYDEKSVKGILKDE